MHSQSSIQEQKHRRRRPSPRVRRRRCAAQKPCTPRFRPAVSGYRFYNPSTGRWLTQDPSGELGGINLYQFVRSDPVGFADANGLAIYRHEPGEFPSLVGPASYVYGETKFERYVQAPLLNGISTLANTPAAIIGFLDWASQRSGMDRWLGMQPSDMLNAMPPLAAEANLLKAHRASVICRAAKAPETGVGMARLLLSGPQKEAFQQVTRFAEGMRMGNANLIYDELATLAQTQAGRQQLLEIHQAVTQIIPMSIGGERTSILVNLQQVTGVLARGGR